jgi:hypothetical protein
MVSEGADSNTVRGNIPDRENTLHNFQASSPTPWMYKDTLSPGVKGPDLAALHLVPTSRINEIYLQYGVKILL